MNDLTCQTWFSKSHAGDFFPDLQRLSKPEEVDIDQIKTLL